MTIREQLQAINHTFEQLHHDFAKIDSERKNLDNSYAAKLTRTEDKWRREQEKVNLVKEDVMKFYRIAKDNSNKELRLSGTTLQKPDLEKLNDLVNRINVFNRNDPIADQAIGLCSKYIAFLNAESDRLMGHKMAEKRSVEQEKKNEDKKLKQKMRDVLASCEQYLRGEDVKHLASLFETIRRDYGITADYFTNWGAATRQKLMMLIGYQQYELDVPTSLVSALSSSLGEHFDEKTKMAHCPCGFTTDSHEDISVEYTDQNEHQMKAGIQALLLNIFRYFKPTDYKVSLFDYYHCNADVLGPLAPLSTMKKGAIDRVQSDPRAQKEAIALLAQRYKQLEAKLGTMSVFEYNKTHKDKIPLRIIIINRVMDTFRTSEEPEMMYLLNNAERFGIIAIRLTKSTDGGSKGKDREKASAEGTANSIRIISDASGRFYIADEHHIWRRFEWLESVDSIPNEFIRKFEKAVMPAEIGTEYFKRYPIHVPTRSKTKRRPIAIPFAIDEDDQTIECSFENETFAAYMMGAARSGKSTLLHTIISGLLMNYHPDEVELWLMDFKMLEFKRYVDHMPPHVKYILLEKSEDLVFDIVDKMGGMLEQRQYEFSKNGWLKLTDVPPDIYMPAIFVIIDEFAQMSQILKETRGEGYASDYTVKLDNLLAKGGAFGFKFIFASQTYETGVEGLTETARKQIQMRFALKNTPSEIRQTLTLSSDEITPEIGSWINSLPPYESLFKWRDADGVVRVGRFRNMYTEERQIETLISKLNAEMHPLAAGGKKNDDAAYREKKPIVIDGSQPKTFASQTPAYKEHEQNADLTDLEENDVLVYAGVPRSFDPARPFAVVNGLLENLLVVGGKREEQMSVLLSVFNCFSRRGYPIEVWSHGRDPLFKRYRQTVLAKCAATDDLDAICGRISEIRQDIERRTFGKQLVAIFGYDMLYNDMEILGADAGARPSPAAPVQSDVSAADFDRLEEQIQQCTDPTEKKRLIDEYNDLTDRYNGTVSGALVPAATIYDARMDLEWILKRAPGCGVHFVLCFDQAKDFLSSKLDEKAFQHKLLFSMAKDESNYILGTRKANELEQGAFLYSSGKESFTMRPHLYRDVPCNGWMVDGDGKIARIV